MKTTSSREYYRAVLEGEKLIVDVAEDGDEAVNLARAHEYDVLLMDVRMPTMDGLAATRLIRGLPNGHSISIIGLSALAFPRDLEVGLASGMDDYLVKPIQPSALRGMVMRWLVRKSGTVGD